MRHLCCDIHIPQRRVRVRGIERSSVWLTYIYPQADCCSPAECWHCCKSQPRHTAAPTRRPLCQSQPPSPSRCRTCWRRRQTIQICCEHWDCSIWKLLSFQDTILIIMLCPVPANEPFSKIKIIRQSTERDVNLSSSYLLQLWGRVKTFLVNIRSDLEFVWKYLSLTIVYRKDHDYKIEKCFKVCIYQ